MWTTQCGNVAVSDCCAGGRTEQSGPKRFSEEVREERPACQGQGAGESEGRGACRGRRRQPTEARGSQSTLLRLYSKQQETDTQNSMVSLVTFKGSHDM